MARLYFQLYRSSNVNQVHCKSLFERPVELSEWKSSSITFQHEGPFFSHHVETSLIITVCHWLRCARRSPCDGKEAGCGSVAQLISTFLPSYVALCGALITSTRLAVFRNWFPEPSVLNALRLWLWSLPSAVDPGNRLLSNSPRERVTEVWIWIPIFFF